MQKSAAWGDELLWSVLQTAKYNRCEECRLVSSLIDLMQNFNVVNPQ